VDMSDVSNLESKKLTIPRIGDESFGTISCVEPPAAASSRLDFERTGYSLPATQKDPDVGSQRVELVSPAEKTLGPWLIDDYRAAPIQIWEGVVIGVDEEAANMSVSLTAKMGNVPKHVADISLEWVHSQDLDLVSPGAVFYWTLYKETKRGTIHNSQELRFRRLPCWSNAQIEQVHAEAKELAKHIRK
jgi:hypothetical protein